MRLRDAATAALVGAVAGVTTAIAVGLAVGIVVEHVLELAERQRFTRALAGLAGTAAGR